MASRTTAAAWMGRFTFGLLRVKELDGSPRKPAANRPDCHRHHIADVDGVPIHLAHRLHLARRVEEVELHVPAIRTHPPNRPGRNADPPAFTLLPHLRPLHPL